MTNEFRLLLFCNPCYPPQHMGDMAQTDSLIKAGNICFGRAFSQAIDNKGLNNRVRKSPDLQFRNADCLAFKRSLDADFRAGVERCELTVGGKYGPK